MSKLFNLVVNAKAVICDDHGKVKNYATMPEQDVEAIRALILAEVIGTNIVSDDLMKKLGRQGKPAEGLILWAQDALKAEQRRRLGEL
jgi:hypothetical protein